MAEKIYTRAWKLSLHSKQTECCYCRERFTVANPPTVDHVIPVASGGHVNDGYVLCCAACNRCRGFAPYDDYVLACQAEHERCGVEGDEYRRPKWRYQGHFSDDVGTRSDPANYIISTMSKREWKRVEKQRRKALRRAS